MLPSPASSPSDLYTALQSLRDQLLRRTHDALVMAESALVPEYGIYCRAMAVGHILAHHDIETLLARYAPDCQHSADEAGGQTTVPDQ